MKHATVWSPPILSILYIASCQYAMAAAPSQTVDPVESWHISASRMSYDQERKRYIAEEGVIVQGGTLRLQADYVSFSNEHKTITASGHVLLRSNNDTIHCDALDLNLQNKTGTLYNGVVFIEENHFYIRGDTIRKTGEKSYEADKASLTTCPEEHPDWMISAKDIKVTVEGYGLARSATFWAGNIPAIYTPIIVFPVKNKRQTGLLPPRFSSSDRKGFEIEQPLFLALSRQMDATLYADVMHKRGIKTGAEFRYVGDSKSRFTFQYDYLNDEKIDDGTPATSDFQIDTTPQRTNRDRYWLRMKGDLQFDDAWSATWDIDHVSDADYLHEFKQGLTGFNETQNTFKEVYGRTIDEYDDTIRENRFNLNRRWQGTSLNMGILWYDDVLARQFDPVDADQGLVSPMAVQDTTLQRLPSTTLSTVKRRMGRSPLYFDMDAEYTYFYRKKGWETLQRELTEQQLIDYGISPSLGIGHRSDIHATLSFPLRREYFFFLPSVGLRQTSWYTDALNAHDTDLSEGSALEMADLENRFEHREMADLGLDLSTTLQRIYTPHNGFAEKIKHEIIPKIEYQYIPDIDQSALPYFDTLDFIDHRNHITWSLTSRFTSRKSVSFSQNPNGNRTEEPQHQYREFAWIALRQSYALDPDIESNRSESFLETPFSSTFTTSSQTASRRFSDIFADIEFTPLSFMTLQSDLTWSPYDNRFNSCHGNLSLKTPRGDSIYTRYGYDRTLSESFLTRLQTPITPTVTAFALMERNLITHTTIESTAGVTLTRPCWSLRLSYSDTPDDRSLSFQLNLLGLGRLK